MSRHSRSSRRGGFALLLVLVVLTLVVVIAMLFLLGAQQERAGTDSYAQGNRVRQLNAAAVNIVMGQISAATKQGTAATPVSWASQPGMIRTYTTSGTLKNAFKLYSWNNLVEDSTFNPGDASELPPQTWASTPALYTDLNQPVNGLYPIVDPAATSQVEDFSIDSTNVAVKGSASNAAPMPVQWLYVLQDGSWVAPTAVAGNNNAVTVAGASATNPIVGRIAFWTDDETSKVNVNTASEGAYWDWPKAASRDELQFAGNPPAKNEFNRVPGHPASTSLSAVFPEMRSGTFSRWTNLTSYTQQLQDIFSTTPRIDWSLGGSKGGTWPINSYTTDYAPSYGSWVDYSTYSPITLDADRLYATSDDFWFTPNHATSNKISSYGVTAANLSQRLFFLSANSSAPETTLFETPRVSLWPVTYPYLSSFWSDFSTNATIANVKFAGRRSTAKPTSFPLPDSTANPLSTLAANNPNSSYKFITPQEQLIGYCATLDTANTSLTTPNNYYFQRLNPDSPTNDWSNIKRNRDLATYLRNEMGQNVPGMGVSLATKWEAAATGNTDWITLNCLDFSRSLVNQYTFDPSSTTGNLLYSFTGVALRQGTVGGAHVSNYAEPNAGAVVPLRATFNGKTYVTEGAYPALKEAAVIFYATARREPTAPTKSDGSVDGNKVTYAGEWQNLITYSPGSPATGKSQTTSMQAMIFFSFSQMNPGDPYYMPVFWVKVTPVGGSFSVNGTSVNLPASHNSVQWSNYANNSNMAQTLAPLFYKQYNQPKIFSNAAPTSPSSPGTLANSSPSYYTLVSDSITLNPDQLNFTFSGTKVQVDIYAPYSSNLDIDPTADSSQLVSSQQIDFSQWSGTLPIPLAPRWNVAQEAMVLSGTVPSRTFVSGVAMPDPLSATQPPVSVDPAQPAAPQGWQVEVVPQIYSMTGTLLSDEGLSHQMPVMTTTGSNTSNNYAVSVKGFIPYVYKGTVTAPGANAPALSYSPALGSGGAISTDMRCRALGLVQKTTTSQYTFKGEGNGADPFSDSTATHGVRAYTFITPYDTVISMVSDPTSGTGKVAGDARLMGRGAMTSTGNGTTSFVRIDTALSGATPAHVIRVDPSTTVVTKTTTTSPAYSIFPPYSTDRAQYHQLGWPGPSGAVSSARGSEPFLTGYLTMPTFGGGTNYMAIRGFGPISGQLGSGDSVTDAVGLEGNVTMNLDPNGDWTSMPGLCFDGGYVSRPDQEYQVLTQDQSDNTYQQVPYFQPYANDSKSQKTDGTYVATAGAFFAPNRQVPSPVILGTLPSDMTTGWQTLLFCPNPAKAMNGGTHPGLGVATNLSSPAGATGAPYTSAPDHLLLDLFWMPVAEPYPISGQFATAGKVNLNYAMMPFPYLVRKTALDAVLKSVWLYAVPSSVSPYYKSFYHMSTLYSSIHTRYPIAVDETLKAFDAKFATGDIFRSATQVCDMFLYPSDPTKTTGNNPLANWDNANANITSWWKNQQLTSDNGREEPYNAIYSRITTKSNTYTVHWRVQALQKVSLAGADPTVWTEGTDRITSELRGSTLIERYLDPNATNIPDYANSSVAATALPMSYFYKWRTISETYFQPSP